MCSPKTQARVSRISKRTAQGWNHGPEVGDSPNSNRVSNFGKLGPEFGEKGLEFGDSPNSGPLSEFGNSPISDRFSPNLGLRSEILQTQFGDSPNSVWRCSKRRPISSKLGCAWRFRDSPSSGPSLEKSLQTRAGFLQPRAEFGDSPNSKFQCVFLLQNAYFA